VQILRHKFSLKWHVPTRPPEISKMIVGVSNKIILRRSLFSQQCWQIRAKLYANFIGSCFMCMQLASQTYIYVKFNNSD
jgi:hypothetical protein